MKLISIYKRNTECGYYYADFSIKNKVYKKSLHTKNRSEAEKNWQKYHDEYQKNLNKLHIENQIKIDIAFKELIAFKQKKLQLSSFKSEIWKVNSFKRFLKKQDIIYTNQINEDVINQFLETLNKHSPKTINNYISIINSIIKFFHGKKYIDRKIDTSIFWQKKEKKKVQIINMEEAKKIIDYCKKIKRIDSRMLMLTPFYTGLRFSEIKALNKRNINLEQKFILVCEKQTYADPKPIQILKSMKAFRKVPILKEFESILIEFMNIKENDYIFSDIKYRFVRYFVEQINKKLKLPVKFHFHQARHFFASLLVENGMSIKKVQTILGHETIETTLNLYSHLIKDWDIEDFKNINI